MYSQFLVSEHSPEHSHRARSVWKAWLGRRRLAGIQREIARIETLLAHEAPTLDTLPLHRELQRLIALKSEFADAS